MKKKYLLNLDEEVIEELKKVLMAQGFTLSGYMNVMAHELLQTFKNMDVKKTAMRQSLEMFVDAAEKLEEVKGIIQKNELPEITKKGKKKK